MNNNFAFIDYESFWDVGYSLRQQSMSTTDYIHDGRFEIHGAAVALGKNDPQWLRGQDLADWIINAHNLKCTLIGHNMLFDGYVTAHCFHKEFTDYFCTLGMIDALFQGSIGRGLDEAMTTLLGWKTGKTNILTKTKGKHWYELTSDEKHEIEIYAIADLQATQELFYRYGPLLPESEWHAMSITLKSFCCPKLEFDSALLKVALKEAEDDREESIKLALEMFNCTENDLRGNNSFIELIQSCNISIPMKPSPSTEGKIIPALAKTDQGFQNLLEHNNPRVVALAEARVAVKSTQGITRAQRFIDLDTATGKFPVAYNYYRAHTGRVSGANKVNAANLKAGSNLRKSIIAPEGYVLGVVDSSQIECRDVGYIAGQDSQTELFRRGDDPYNDMAQDIFNKEIDRKGRPDTDFIPGFIGKTARLGLGFGMGGPKFHWTCISSAKVRLGLDLDMSMNEASRIVYDVYRPKHDKIVKFWTWLQAALHRMVADDAEFSWEYPDGELRFIPKENKIYFPNGTYLFYPLLSYDDGNFTYINKRGSTYINKKIYGALFCENIVQKHARDIVIGQGTKMEKELDIPLVMQTYDEWVALLPEEEADTYLAEMLRIMKTPPEWAKTLPLGAEGGYAREYSK